MTRRNLKTKFEEGKMFIEVREPVDRNDIGTCYFCKDRVYASQGQLVKHYRGLPTHKKCRQTV